jgi:nucleotide-binding universal stress UspA family protein
MNALANIVVGVDGSEGGDRALRWAVREATSRGRAIQAVLALDSEISDSLLAAAAGTAAAQTREWARERAEQTLADAVAAAVASHPGAAIASEVVDGSPAEVLSRVARDADFLVLGSHGRGRLFRAALGSVAEQCVRLATCPVVVIPVPHNERLPAPAEVQVAR